MKREKLKESSMCKSPEAERSTVYQKRREKLQIRLKKQSWSYRAL